MVAFANISDIHIGGSAASEERAAAVLRHADSLGLDAIIVTGDIADHALPEEYEVAARLMKTRTPLIVCPGNHDATAPFEQGLGPVNQVLRLDGVTLALTDSSVPGEDFGHLSDETLTWLDEVLAERPDVPAFIGFHHQPVPLGVPFLDGIALREPERLAGLLSRHPHVVAVLTGHAHTAVQARFAGLPLVIAPGVISTSLTRWETDERIPVSYELPPAFALHVFENGDLVTHFRPVILK